MAKKTDLTKQPTAAQIKAAAGEMTLSARHLHRQGPKPADSCYVELVCLSASIVVGPDEEKLCEFLGWRPKRVVKFLEDARKAGVLGLSGKLLMGDDWFHPETGSLSLLLDAMSINGKLIRRVA